MANKTFTQQRAVLKPMKNSNMFEVTEEEDEDEYNEEDDIFIEDGSSSCYSNSNGLAVTQDTRNETMLLAQFLSTTGPEEYTTTKGDNKAQQQFKRASRLLSKLRKRPTMPVLRSGQTTFVDQPAVTKKLNHVPLPVYEPPSTTTTTTTSNNNHDNHTRQTKQQSFTNTNTYNHHSPQPPKISTTFDNNKQSSKDNRKSILTPSQLRDSGIYSETGSDRNSYSVVSNNSHTIPIPPLPAFLNDLQQFPQPPYVHNNNNNNKSSNNHHHHHNNNTNNSPQRPAPMPPALASAAIAACSPTSICSSNHTASTTIRSVPEAALKRRSVRLRHVQVQTDMGTQTKQEEVLIKEDNKSSMMVGDKQACPHCRQVITPSSNNNRIRRPSCPPALSSGPILSVEDIAEQTDSKKLLVMIMNLKSQLAEEKQCRIKLEKAMYQRQSDDRRELLAKEKDRWAGDCLWLNDRIALLPE